MNNWQLQQRLSLPLAAKIIHTQNVIRQWCDMWDDKVYLSYSGGYGSTVLADIILDMGLNIPFVFVNTGNEYTEIVQQVRRYGNRVTWLRPFMLVEQVVTNYGYSIASKKIARDINKLRNQNLSERYRNYLLNGDERGNYGKIPERWKCLLDAPFECTGECCRLLKHGPLDRFTKQTGMKPFTGEMATESRERKRQYMEHGCNFVGSKVSKSMPLSIWTANDLKEYTKQRGLIQSEIYDMGEKRTGCVICMYGIHLEKGLNRFQRLARTHPKFHRLVLPKLKIPEVMDYIKLPWY
jgi:3'-phosphoadenosine 5'-phosphosulfate sulfotransferase (PAPS reductase)/FAD synthetase